MPVQTCVTCHTPKELSLENFYFVKRTSRFEKSCKICRKAYFDQHRKINREKVLSTSRKCYQKKKHLWKNYYEENKESILNKKHFRDNANREHVREIGRRSYENTRINRLIEARMTRLKNNRATPLWLTIEQLDAIRAIHREAILLSEDTKIPRHVDHIFPLNGKTCCGLNVPWNLQIITAFENISKGNKLPLRSTSFS